MDGSLIWSYFHNNDVQQLSLFDWFYSTGSSNADDYNLATDDHCNNIDFCSCKRLVIGKFFLYCSGPEEIHEAFISIQNKKILVIKIIADLGSGTCKC